MKIRTREYLHSNNESFATWVTKDGIEVHESDLPQEAQRKLHYRLYEVSFDLEIDTETGEYRILEVQDGRQVLVPIEES